MSLVQTSIQEVNHPQQSNDQNRLLLLQDPATTPLCEEHRYVAQRYAWPLVLFRQRKCHVRVYALITSDGRAHVHNSCFLHVANDLFSSSISLIPVAPFNASMAASVLNTIRFLKLCDTLVLVSR